jgi:hypothetical protein
LIDIKGHRRIASYAAETRIGQRNALLPGIACAAARFVLVWCWSVPAPEAVMKTVSTDNDAYVVYDPPVEGYPFLGVLFRAEARPKVFVFPTQEEAVAFLTSKALKELPTVPN